MPRLIILFTAIFFFSNCSTPPKNNDSALQAALTDFNKGDFLSCEEKLKEYTTKYPEDFKGWSY